MTTTTTPFRLASISSFLVASLYLVSLSSAQTGCGSTPTGTCSASVTVQPTQPGHGSFVYNNIMVQNTGSCAINAAFVDIMLPPYAEAFAYYNVSNSTGELFGLPNPMTPGSNLLGGTVVLNSARTPMVSVRSVECDPACSPSAPVKRSIRPAVIRPEEEITKVEVQWGANPYWVAIHLIGDSDATQEVRISDASSISQQFMKREDWDNKVVFTFSGQQMKLPLSLELTSIAGDKIKLPEIITTFSHAILDTGLSYITGNTDEVTLLVAPKSNPNWIGLAPQSTRNVTNVALKAHNTDWVQMEQTELGFFEFSSQNLELQLPIAVELTFDSECEPVVFENAIEWQ